MFNCISTDKIASVMLAGFIFVERLIFNDTRVWFWNVSNGYLFMAEHM